MDDADFARIFALLETDETGLRRLAEILGYDPQEFYIGTNLSGVDLRGQNLKKMRFDGTNLQSALIDRATSFDREIEDELNEIVSKRYVEISDELLSFTENFFSNDRFVSKGWFIKRIIPDAARSIARNRRGWADTIDESPEFRSFFASKQRRRIELTISDYDYQEGAFIGKRYGGRGGALTALIVVGLLNLIGYDPKTDPASISRDSLLREYKLFEQNHKKYF